LLAAVPAFGGAFIFVGRFTPSWSVSE